MSESTISTDRINELLSDLQAGSLQAREELFLAAAARLFAITRKLKRSFPMVGRWEQTEDVYQNASLRLYKAMARVEIQNPLHFFRLAALQIRRELIDLARCYERPHGLERNHHTQCVVADEVQPASSWELVESTHTPVAEAQWAEFHTVIERMPQAERDVTELLWYHGMSQDEAAEILGVDSRTVRRRWRAARLLLREQLQGEMPGI